VRAVHAALYALIVAAVMTAVAQEPIVREIKLVDKFDRNADKRLDATERSAAREYLAAHPELHPPARRTRLTAGSPGPRVNPADVTPASGGLYDVGALRTLFLEFDSPAWEQELAAFHGTDVDVPATMMVDGTRYAEVGVHFRGHNSFLAVPEGRKRSLTLSPDFVIGKQRLLGYRGLHLLNAFQDPTFVRAVLYLEIAREYIPAPQANHVRVVVNGESWGIYVNQQRFDSDFVRDNFGTTGGTRWKALNNAPGGGLSYLGDELARYKEAYEIKSKEDPKAWAALMTLTRVIHETPPEKLAAALAPILDVDGTLMLLALDNALVNTDGYWEDGSDYDLYLDEKGRFHLIPYDVNESFKPVGGGRGGQANAALDPFAMANDPNKALLAKMLQSPELRTRYLRNIRAIAEKGLDWNRLQPIVARHQARIQAEVARDTRKLYSTDEFTTAVYGDGKTEAPVTTLKGFVEQRRAFLLNHPDVLKATAK
jgi:hypothetical protein